MVIYLNASTLFRKGPSGFHTEEPHTFLHSFPFELTHKQETTRDHNRTVLCPTSASLMHVIITQPENPDLVFKNVIFPSQSCYFENLRKRKNTSPFKESFCVHKKMVTIKLKAKMKFFERQHHAM